MITKIYAQNPSERELSRVVSVLEHDGVVIYPTDGVYAFGCSLRSPKRSNACAAYGARSRTNWPSSSRAWPRWPSTAGSTMPRSGR